MIVVLGMTGPTCVQLPETVTVIVSCDGERLGRIVLKMYVGDAQLDFAVDTIVLYTIFVWAPEVEQLACFVDVTVTMAFSCVQFPEAVTVTVS
jgi:hypothetical protein